MNCTFASFRQDDQAHLRGGENGPERFVAIFKEICEMQVEDDGLRFDAGTIMAERITEDADYEDRVLGLFGRPENARVPIQIDLGSVSLWFVTRTSQRTTPLLPCHR